MGWLDHSTNNIILDAVLTDYGRQQLATASSAFKIDKYALADDEVDYRYIKKYGRTVGKERIEKLTPIFEALTNPNIALKYLLIGREGNANSTTLSTSYLPFLTLSSDTPTISIVAGSKTEATVTVNLKYNGTSAVPNDLLQTIYTVSVPDRFFFLSGGAGITKLDAPDTARGRMSAGDPNRIAFYTLEVSSSTTQFSFKVKPRSIDNTTLSVYGKKIDSSAKRIVYSNISIRGEKMGTVLDVPITYTAELATTT